MIKELIISVPRQKRRKEPRRKGINVLSGVESMVSVRFGDYEKQLVTEISQELGLTLAEFVRETSVRCAKAYRYGVPTGSRPFARCHTDLD